MRNQYIAVNKKQNENVLGMYAAGDVWRPPWQEAKAVGEARVAGLSAVSYIRQKRSEGKTEAVERQLLVCPLEWMIRTGNQLAEITIPCDSKIL